MYEKSKDEQLVPATGVRKSFSEGHISLFSRSTSNDMEKSDLETIEENPSVDIKPEKINEYTKRAKTLIEQASDMAKIIRFLDLHRKSHVLHQPSMNTKTVYFSRAFNKIIMGVGA